MRARGLTRCAVADAHHLQFRINSFDGAWADRTVQHLVDPHAAVTDLVRVVRPGGRLLAAHGLVDVTVEPRTLVVRDPTAVDNVLGLRSWAATAAQRGGLDPSEARAFEDQFDEAVRTHRFTYAVTFFLTAATVP